MSFASSARPHSLPPSSARAPRGRCCCHAAAPRDALLCGSSESVPTICSPSRPATRRSRCCSRPIANACATSSICPRFSKYCAPSAIARSASTSSIRKTPSPFASSLLFSYVANYIYDGDAPLAERRAQALSIDQEQLRDLLGDADLRELLDADAIAEVEEQLQALTETTRARSADGIHDLLLRLGDLSREELARRVASPELLDHLPRLLRARRLLEIKVATEKRLIAIEDAARYRDALGVPSRPDFQPHFSRL